MNGMISAIGRTDIAAVKRLLDDGSVDVNDRIAYMRNSPLLVFAANLGRVEIVALLLDAGARINDVDDRGESACLVAVRHRHTAVVELLVARNANVSLRNRSNETPITYAILCKHDKLVMLLIDAAVAAGTLDDDTTCSAAAVSVNVIRWLLFKHRINFSAIRGKSGRTPLHRAVGCNGNASVLDLLIEVAGVDVDVRDKSGCTAAYCACIQGDAVGLARLVAAGAISTSPTSTAKRRCTTVGTL